MFAPGLPGFLAWLQKYQPDLYRYARPRALAGQLAGLGQDIADGTASTSTTGGTMLDSIKNVLTTAAQVYATTKLTQAQLNANSRLLDLQVARAQQGLPPLDIDPSTYGVPQIRVGVATDTKTFLMWGGIALGALILVAKLGGRRRHT